MIVYSGVNMIVNSFRTLIAAGLRAPKICRVCFDVGMNYATRFEQSTGLDTTLCKGVPISSSRQTNCRELLFLIE